MTESTLLILTMMAAGRCMGFLAGLVFADRSSLLDGPEYFLRQVVILFLSLVPILFLDQIATLPTVNYYTVLGLITIWLTGLGMAAGLATVYRGRDAGIGRFLVFPALFPVLDLLIAIILLTMGSEDHRAAQAAQRKRAAQHKEKASERHKRVLVRQAEFERSQKAHPKGYVARRAVDPDLAELMGQNN